MKNFFYFFQKAALSAAFSFLFVRRRHDAADDLDDLAVGDHVHRERPEHILSVVPHELAAVRPVVNEDLLPVEFERARVAAFEIEHDAARKRHLPYHERRFVVERVNVHTDPRAVNVVPARNILGHIRKLVPVAEGDVARAEVAEVGI